MTTREEVEKLAKKIAKEYLKSTPSAHPKSVMAASAYLAYIAKGCYIFKGKKMTQREIARIYGTTENTIRNVYKDILKKVKVKDKDYNDMVREWDGGR